MVVIAFTPRCGCEPCAAAPKEVAVIQAPPRSASPTRRSVGSPTMHASCVSSPRSSSTFVPCTPPSSSSAARWNVRVPRELDAGAAERRAGRERGGDRSLHVARAAADQPAALDRRRRTGAPTTCRASRPGRCRGVRSRRGSGRARAPIDGDDARAAGLAADDLGVRAEPARNVGGDARPPRPRSHRGFSRRAAISARASATTSSGSTAAAAASAAVGADASSGSRMAADATAGGTRCGIRDRAALRWTRDRPGAVLRAHLDPAPRHEPAPGDRAGGGARPRRLRPASRRSCSPSARRRCHGTPARSRSRAACAIPTTGRSRRPRSARRPRRSGSTPRCREILGALPPVHTFVSAILVTPFVATLDVAADRCACGRAEIARVFTVPVADARGDRGAACAAPRRRGTVRRMVVRGRRTRPSGVRPGSWCTRCSSSSGGRAPWLTS